MSAFLVVAVLLAWITTLVWEQREPESVQVWRRIINQEQQR